MPSISRWPAEAREIEASHCGKVDAVFARRLAQARAQVTRDPQMARAVEAHAERGAVLLAGNGDMRLAIGVPGRLSPASRTRSESIGVLEAGSDGRVQDRSIVVRAVRLADPCTGVSMPGLPASAPAPGRQ